MWTPTTTSRFTTRWRSNCRPARRRPTGPVCRSSPYRDLLTIRSTESAFGLTSSADVQSALSFPLSGKEETPGVITMKLGKLVVVFNATPVSGQQRIADVAGTGYALHPVQAGGS